MDFTCHTCNQQHNADDLSFGADAPVQWSLLTEEQRARSILGGEQCSIVAEDGRHLFVRACLEIPVKGTAKSFTWGVWVSLSEASFFEMSDHWEDVDRTKLGPYFGWLCTAVPEYPDTVYLKTMVHQRDVGQRPIVILEPTDHPLSTDQREGIDPARLQEIIVKVLHS